METSGHHYRQQRRSIRLRGYDYSQAGAYFVTICTHSRVPLFGEIQGDEMRLSEAGLIVQAAWDNLPEHYPHVELDAWVIMPNHVHGIIVLAEPLPVGAGLRPAPTPRGVQSFPGRHRAVHLPAPTPRGVQNAAAQPAPTQHSANRHPLSEIIRAFKSFSARRINARRGAPGVPVWQRNYYEHIIRNEAALHDIRQYIIHNPANWMDDPENPRNISRRS